MKFLRLVNRFVSVLLVSVALTAALQFGGVASQAKDSADFEALAKAKMHETSELIDGIFNIPIVALRAVSDLVQTVGPIHLMTAEQRIESRKARAEVLNARAANKQAKNEAKALRRAERGRSVTYARESPVVFVPFEKTVVKEH